MRKYLYLLKTSFVNRLDYRQELITNFLISCLIFVGFLIFWRAVFVGRESVKGFSFPEIMQYYVFLSILSDVVDSNFAFTLSENIIDGKITNLLVKPVKVKLWMIVDEIGQILPLLIAKLIVFSSFFYLFIGKYTVKPENIAFVLLILPFSYLVNANLYFMFGCFSFWLSNVKGLLYGVRRIVLFISGGYVPLIFFPEFAQQILNFLPFRYVFSIPTSIFTNKFDFGNDGLVLLGLVLWSVILYISANLFFKYSYKANESIGI